MKTKQFVKDTKFKSNQLVYVKENSAIERYLIKSLSVLKKDETTEQRFTYADSRTCCRKRPVRLVQLSSATMSVPFCISRIASVWQAPKQKRHHLRRKPSIRLQTAAKKLDRCQEDRNQWGLDEGIWVATEHRAREMVLAAVARPLLSAINIRNDKQDNLTEKKQNATTALIHVCSFFFTEMGLFLIFCEISTMTNDNDKVLLFDSFSLTF